MGFRSTPLGPTSLGEGITFRGLGEPFTPNDILGILIFTSSKASWNLTLTISVPQNSQII